MKSQLNNPYGVWFEGLRPALFLLESYRVETNSQENSFLVYEPECQGLYFTEDGSGVIIDVNPNKLADEATIEFFNSRKAQAIFKWKLGGIPKIIKHDNGIAFQIENNGNKPNFNKATQEVANEYAK